MVMRAVVQFVDVLPYLVQIITGLHAPTIPHSSRKRGEIGETCPLETPDAPVTMRLSVNRLTPKLDGSSVTVVFPRYSLQNFAGMIFSFVSFQTQVVNVNYRGR
jgi:hypothetical protein